MSSLLNPAEGGIPDYTKGIAWPTSTVAQPAPADGVWCAPFVTKEDAPFVYINGNAITVTGGERLTGCGIGTVPVKKGDLCSWGQGGVRPTRFYPF